MIYKASYGVADDAIRFLLAVCIIDSEEAVTGCGLERAGATRNYPGNLAPIPNQELKPTTNSTVVFNIMVTSYRFVALVSFPAKLQSNVGRFNGVDGRE